MDREKVEGIAREFRNILVSTRRFDKNGAFESSQGQKAILINIYLTGENAVNPGELSKILGVGSGRIGNALKVLEGKGYIVRKHSESDMRKVEVILTPEGKKKAEEHYNDLLSTTEYVIEKIGYEKLQTFLSVLKEILSTHIEYIKQKGENEDA